MECAADTHDDADPAGVEGNGDIPRLSHEQLLRELGVTQDDIDALPDVELE